MLTSATYNLYEAYTLDKINRLDSQKEKRMKRGDRNV